MDGHYAPPGSAVQPIKARLIASGAFDVGEQGGVVTASRRRRVPGSGLLRLLIPRVVVRVRLRGAAAVRAVRPDAIAWTMLVFLVGGVVVEASLDRVRYPRDYPPAFVYGLALGYVGLWIAEVVATRRAVRRALADG